MYYGMVKSWELVWVPRTVKESYTNICIFARGETNTKGCILGACHLKSWIV